MGALNYYIKIAGDEQCLNTIAAEYAQNTVWREMFGLTVCENEDGKHTLEIEALIDNFLPTNHMLFSFLSRWAACDLYIVDDCEEYLFGTMSKTDFMQYMYRRWESKIDFAYSQFGTMIVKYRHYHKNRRKLYAKYYIKIR